MDIKEQLVEEDDQLFLNDISFGHSLKNEEDDDPYEVIHCKCGTHTSRGFMIQVAFSFNR